MFVKRCLTKNVLETLESFPVVFVNGPRQAGKSTLVQTLAKKTWPAAYVTFDEASQLGAAQANPESFLRGYEDRLILDEVQMVPDLFRALKLLVDEARLSKKSTANGRYLLTGSAAILALPQLSNALVGRMDVLTLYPLSVVELSNGRANFLERLFDAGFKAGKLTGGKTLMEMIRRATFPEIMDADDRVRHRWYESYLTTILQREVHQIADIAKLGVLPNLLRLLASRAGSLLNDADLARSLGQNAVTTKNYRKLLQMLFLTVDVPPWFRNIGKRLVKAPKGYLIDTSLLCHV
jgi:predicted AAA+ superfamily ATPase